MSNPYFTPEDFGLKILGEVEWSDECYQFDKTVLWEHPDTGKYYIASDCGCSCPSPFEDYHELAALEEVTVDGAITALESRRRRETQAYENTYGQVESLELIKKLRGLK